MKGNDTTTEKTMKIVFYFVLAIGAILTNPIGGICILILILWDAWNAAQNTDMLLKDIHDLRDRIRKLE